MFGIHDFSILMAFLLILLTTLISAVCGLFLWYKGHTDEKEEREDSPEGRILY